MNDSSTWEPVIGLEVHVQLNTQSKLFSKSPSSFSPHPNKFANIVDLAIPGTLPVLNREALHKAIAFGIAVSARISRTCKFERKSYFYPDLPKGYQITQLSDPIVGPGTLEIPLEGAYVKTVGITRAHLEEDAGKSIHDRFMHITAIDLNRAGIPLLEIVTEPQLNTASEAAACFRQLHKLVTWLGICDGNLNEGSMRCDANVSVRKRGDEALGNRTEIKNVNSFRFVERAVNYEIGRQISTLERGETVKRETRLYDVDKDETRRMRTKEYSDDYRYFPDPDLLPVAVPEELVRSIRGSMPELPNIRQQRFLDQFKLSPEVAALLTRDRETSDYFEKALEIAGNPRLVANWVLGVVSSILNRDQLTIEHFPLPPEALGEILCHVNKGAITDRVAKQAFDQLLVQGGSVNQILHDLSGTQISDRSELTQIVQSILDSHPNQVKQLTEGKDKVLGFLIGQAMKASHGNADPKQLGELFRKLTSTQGGGT